MNECELCGTINSNLINYLEFKIYVCDKCANAIKNAENQYKKYYIKFDIK